MPALIVPYIVAMGASVAVATAIAYGIVFLTSFAFSSYQQRKARRAARDAYNANLQDRLVMATLSDGTRSRIYGRVRNVDGVIFKATRGEKSELYRLVIALAGHECDAIEDVYFNDDKVTLGAPDGQGWQSVTSAPYVKADDRSKSVQAVGTGAAQTVTLPFPPIAGSVRVSFDLVDAGGSPSEPGGTLGSQSWLTPTISGSDVTFTAPEGLTVTIVYRGGTGSPRVVVRKWLGAPGQDLSPRLVTDFPGLCTAADKFAGICLLEVELTYDTDVFPSGVPTISGVVRGAKILDTRTGVTAWSEVPSLIARDWAYYAHGGACLAGTVDDDDVNAAANACDVSNDFTDSDGTVTAMPLYRAGIVIKTDRDPASVMDEIVEAMAGKWGWGGGMLKMRAGAYRAPVATLTEDWLSGTEAITIVPEPPADQAVNIMRATIADKAQSYTAVQAPEVRAEAYITNDGRELPRETTYEAVTDHLRAQHISGVTMREERSGLNGTLPCNLRAFSLQMFDVLLLQLPHFGFDNKPVEILNWQFSGVGGVVLTYKETGASIFDPDALFTAQDATPNTSLPNPFNVPAITGLTAASGTAHLIRQADGTIVSRVWVEWDEITDEAVLSCAEGINIQYGPVIGDVFRPGQFSEVLPGSATGAYLQSGVQDGRNLVIAVRARNTLVKGEWCSPIIHTVVGKTEPPSAVEGFSHTIAATGVGLEWAPCPDVDYSETELRTGASWATGLPLTGSAPTRISGSRYLWPRPAAGTYQVWAKHIDTTRNYSATAALETVVVDETALVQWGEINGRPLDLFNMVLTPTFASGEVGTWTGKAVVAVSGQPWAQALQVNARDNYEDNIVYVHGGETLYVAADLNSQGTPFSVGFGFASFNVSGGLIGYTLPFGQSQIVAGQDWTRVAAPFTTPPGTSYILPWIQIDGFSGLGTALATNLYIGRAQLGATLGADWADNLTSIPYASVYNNDDSVALGFSTEDWEAGAALPAGWTYWTGAIAPSRETGIVRAGRSAVRYAVAGGELGMYRAADLSAAPLPAGTFLAGSVDFYLAAATSGSPLVLVRLYHGTYPGGAFIDTRVQPAAPAAINAWQRTPWTARVPAGQRIERIEIYIMASWAGGGSSFSGDVIFDNLLFALYDNSTDNKSLALSGAGTLSTGGVPLGTVTISGLGYTGALDATTDLALVARGVVLAGNRATKSSGVDAWDSDVYSRDAFTGGSFASARIGPSSGFAVMFGLNSDADASNTSPSENAYKSLDYAWFVHGGICDFYESGVGIGFGEAVAAGDLFSVVYTGLKVRYERNGVVKREVAASAGQRLFFDSAFYSVGAELQNVRFGPMGKDGTDGVDGVGIPGTSSYAHFRYSDDNGATFTSGGGTTPGSYLGVYSDTSPTASTNPADYTWALIRGTDGTSIPGTSSYVHIKYSNDGGASFTASSGETPGAYLGQYVDNTVGDSANPTDYTWALIKGDDGAPADQPITASLTAYACTVPADSDGLVSSFASAVTTMAVFEGLVDVTGSWSIARTNGAGVGSSLSGATLTVSSLSSDDGYVDLVATRSGFPTQTLRFNIAKSKAARPASGPVQFTAKFSDSYHLAPTHSSAGISFQPNGVIQTKNNAGSFVNDGNWYDPTTTGVGSGFWVRVSLTSGDSPTSGGALDTWLALSSDRFFSVTTTGSSVQTKISNLSYAIASDSAGATVVATGTCRLSAIQDV